MGDRWHRKGSSRNDFFRRLLQVISGATQVAISRRVQRYKLSLRGRQQEEGKRAALASNTSKPMIWGWSVDALYVEKKCDFQVLVL